MPAFEMVFAPSRLRRIMALLLGVACMVCSVVYFDGVRAACALLLCAVASIWAWLEPRPRVVALRVDVLGKATLCLHGSRKYHDATLLAGSFIHPYACFLKWHCQNQTFWQAVLPDCADADDLRRLRVWAKFQ